MLKINSIKIENIGIIKSLKLDFNQGFNIICGANGVGKTTILDCLAQSFTINNHTLTRNANAPSGHWEIAIENDDFKNVKSFVTYSLEPDTYNSIQGLYLVAPEVIVFKTHRNIPYKSLKHVERKQTKDVGIFANEIKVGSLPNYLKNWFVDMYLWSVHNKDKKQNLNLAKKCFSLLNPDISFSKVDSNSYDIFVKTPNGEIYLEYLSSGYKSCLALLLGLIMEIEYRIKDKSPETFEGVIFIDELDLHLHPEWQAKIYFILKQLLPNAQFFTSTHSPHIIQVAEPDEIIPLVFDKENNVKLNDVIKQKYGFQGWTVDEILTDVMGMKKTRSVKYEDVINKFNKAIDEENYVDAKIHIVELKDMLHPNNILNKILDIHLASITITND